MAYVDWKIRGKKMSACNCNYGCPCEFNAPPTNEICEGLEAMEIEEGYFGETRLDGIKFAALFSWPGPVHEGGGTAQGIIDEAASEAQREALFKILDGEEQELTTAFNIYGSTIVKEFDPVFTTIDFVWDYENRTGSFSIPNVAECRFEPIRNPVTGAPHRAQIVLPEGFEFRTAEMASSTFKGTGDIQFDHADRYGFFTYAAYGPYGVIEEKR